ncbi:hypothetical protein M4S86_001171 [Escherichia coli]|nr:hypothetical protein [Escherichia coli]EJQ1824656.1 hypothetical protein [Escherichia coli]
MTDMKKAAPIWSRLSEQLTCCAVCTCEIKHEHDSRDQAGGQGYQSGERLLVAFRRLGHFAKKSSSANLSGLEDKKGFVFSTLDNSASSRSMVFSCFCRMISQSGEILSPSCSDAFSVIVLPCKAMRRSTSHHGADSDYSDSLALRRWRRLISPSSAETINCPVLSPSSFKFSTASAIACGTRASSFLDFALTAFVAISDFLVIRWLTVYTQENGKTLLTWLTPVTNIVADTFIKVIDEKTKPRKCRYHSQGF